MDHLRALPVAVAAMVLCCELWAVQPAQGFSPQGVMKVRVLNGRCILRGKSIDEAYFTLKNGTCVRAACHAKDKLVRFTAVLMLLGQLGYKLDRKLGDFRARFREDRRPADTGAVDPSSPTTGVLDTRRRRKFRRLVCKPSSQEALARRSRPAC